jgi:hypothetical protein
MNTKVIQNADLKSENVDDNHSENEGENENENENENQIQIQNYQGNQ